MSEQNLAQNYRDAVMNELLDAQARCVYHGRGWKMLGRAVLHLMEFWMSESCERPIHIICFRGDGVFVRGFE
jgi:hypothetical protein